MKEATKRNIVETAVFVSRAGGDCIAGNVARNLLFGRQSMDLLHLLECLL